MARPDYDVAIIGAGPAGLTAGYLLAKKGKKVIVFESDPTYVGGISRTVEYKGYRFDIGGHRFFSKAQAVEDFWTEILGDEMLDRPRSSRIFYNGKFFAYPLKGAEALFKLGIRESIVCVLSYTKAKLFPTKNPTNLEDWVTNQFGKRLYQIFFKTYTEKVWGMDCKLISADWAAQRIKGLSLWTAIVAALVPKRKPKSRQDVVKTLIDSFRYPRLGPGMMWEVCAKKMQTLGGELQMGRRVTGAALADGVWSVATDGAEARTVTAAHVISSMPLRELMLGLTPRVRPETAAAAKALSYRDFITVALMVKGEPGFPDNWIYIHDPGVMVGRVQNFKSWSPELIPHANHGCYGLEYFCFEGDGLWTSSDHDLIERGKRELEKIGLAKAGDVVDGHVVRQPKAYPVYDDVYTKHVNVIREEIARSFPRLHVVGRNGMHKYNNQDHAMMTAMLTVENILDGGARFDIWEVNQDAEYHEAGKAGAQAALASERLVPRKVT